MWKVQASLGNLRYGAGPIGLGIRGGSRASSGNGHGLHWVKERTQASRQEVQDHPGAQRLQATRPGQGSHRQATTRSPEARDPGAFSHRAREEIRLRSGKNGYQGFGSGWD